MREPDGDMSRVPRNGSGEPAQAWSPAWDMVAADPCNGFRPQPGGCPTFPDWHTQRCGRSQNSRNLYDQTRALQACAIAVRSTSSHSAESLPVCYLILSVVANKLILSYLILSYLLIDKIREIISSVVAVAPISPDIPRVAIETPCCCG